MKMNLFKIFFASLGFLFAFSSCLDDGDGGTTTVENAFSYVSTLETGQKILKASAHAGYVIPISNDEFRSSTLQPGDCVFANYKYSNDNLVGTSYYEADYINIIENNSYRIYRKQSQVIPELRSVNITELEEDKEYFQNLATSYGSNGLIIFDGDDLGNRWFITYAYYKKESEQAAKLVVSFDESKQVNRNGEKLPEGEAVLDFQLERQGSSGEGDAKRTIMTEVIDFTSMRPQLARFASSKNKELKINFRFWKEKTDAAEGTPKYDVTISPHVVTLSYKETGLQD